MAKNVPQIQRKKKKKIPSHRVWKKVDDDDLLEKIHDEEIWEWSQEEEYGDTHTIREVVRWDRSRKG